MGFPIFPTVLTLYLAVFKIFSIIFFRSFDLFDFFINTTNFDNLPISVLEAMALGLPIISTNVGGLPFFLKEANSILVNKNDSVAMANAIIQIMKVTRNKFSQTVYNIRSFAPTAEEFRRKVIEIFPKAEIRYEINEKRQKMVDGWPEDTDDSAARQEWNWQPIHTLDRGLNEYLIPELKQIYQP